MKDKRVIVGVSGGIAAYKAAELVRLLVRAGADTRVAMTAHATKFVTPLTFEALTGNRVARDMWGHGAVPMDHIHWGQESDLIIIAPATANFIAKMAHGIGDDFLSTLILAAAAKVLVCPSMNMHMFQSPAVRDNIKLLKQRGIVLMMPSEGELACGAEGLGRLPEPADILEHARMLLSEQDLLGLRVLVTAGPTVEPLDPIRYLTNRSSGKMGYALARAARLRGADVMLVSGPTGLKPPQDVNFCGINTAEEMRQAVLGGLSQCDVIIKAAAVSDYRPRDKADQKMKKGEERQTLELVKNPDILADLGSMKGDSARILVGFCAETEDLMVNAAQKLEKKNLDMIVANDVSQEDAGFESDINLVKVMYRDGHMEEFPLMTKDDLANQLLERIKDLWEHRSASR